MRHIIDVALVCSHELGLSSDEEVVAQTFVSTAKSSYNACKRLSTLAHVSKSVPTIVSDRLRRLSRAWARRIVNVSMRTSLIMSILSDQSGVRPPAARMRGVYKSASHKHRVGARHHMAAWLPSATQ